MGKLFAFTHGTKQNTESFSQVPQKPLFLNTILGTRTPGEIKA